MDIEFSHQSGLEKSIKDRISHEKLLSTYKEKGFTSIAFPLLGAQNGGLESEKVLGIMNEYLKQCDIPVEIYIYNPEAQDDLIEKFSSIIADNTESQIYSQFRMNGKVLYTLKDLLEDDKIKSVMSLTKIQGLGIKSVERIFLSLCE